MASSGSNRKVQTRAEEQCQLLERILFILRTQLDGQPVTAGQRERLLAAIAHFTSEVRGE